MMRVANCSADISSEKKPTIPPLTVSGCAIGFGLELIGSRDIEGDVGRERGLAHAGAPGDDHEIGGLQAAHIAIEIGKAGRDPGQAPVALKGLRRHIDGGGQGVREALKAALVAAGLGNRIELALGLLDLLARARVDRRVIGRVDDILADEDQIAAKREIVNGAAIVLGIDDGRRFRREPGEILRHGDAAKIMLAEKGLQGDRRGELSGADQLRGDIENPPVQFLRKMFGSEKIGDPVEGVIVDEDRAKQRLFRLDIVRREPEVGSGLAALASGSLDRQDCRWLA